ncbi:MAG: DNA-binding protein [Gammaproteobacteria bacterium]
MNTVILDVQTLDDALATAMRVMETREPEPHERISFASPELMWRTLGGKRGALVRTMCGAGPMSIREAARRVGRDVKSVHSDVHALLNAGVLWRTDDGRIEFPFDAIRVEFTIEPERSAA